MKHKTTIALLAVFLVGAMALSAFAFPFGGEGFFGKGQGNMTQMQEQRTEHQAEMQARQEAVQAAIDAADYDAWAEAIEGTPMGERMTDLINEDNFDRFLEMHDLMQDAKDSMDQARAIAEELGIEGPGFGMGAGPDGMRGGHGMRQGKGPGMKGGMGQGGCPFAEE